jgi:hypothetical protein
MTEAAHTTTSAGSVDPGEQVLRGVSETFEVVVAAEARQFRLAVEWARLHPGDVVDTSVPWADRELQVAGEGAPTVAEFAIADYALAAGMSTDAGRAFLGDAVETRHRLPRLWSRVMAGQVRVWKARKIAQSTYALPPDAAAYVDAHVARVAHRCSFAQIERTVDKARALFDPEEVEAQRLAASDERHFRIRTEDLTTHGLVYVDGLVDLPAALALDAAITERAHTLLGEYPELSLDQRRAMAVGLLGSTDSQSDAQTEIVLYAHTTPGAGGGGCLVEVENTRSLVTLEELTEWCGLGNARVTLKPVIDLNTELSTARYTPTPAQHEQAILTHPTCVYPGCSRPSRRCDLDHITPWPTGETTTANLAPLCRGHHRLKTHGGWTYVRTSPTSFLWTSPTGRTYPSGRPPGRHIR